MKSATKLKRPRRCEWPLSSSHTQPSSDTHTNTLRVCACVCVINVPHICWEKLNYTLKPSAIHQLLFIPQCGARCSPSSDSRPQRVQTPSKNLCPCDNGRIKLVTHGVWAFVSFVPSEGSCSSRRWRAERAWSRTRRWQAPSPHGGRNTWRSCSRVCGSHSSAKKSGKTLGDSKHFTHASRTSWRWGFFHFSLSLG